MNNYQQTLYHHMNHQLNRWLGADGERVSGEEVYRFLHSLSGTAGTIGLQNLSATARDLMESFPSGMDSSWDPSDLERLLGPLTTVLQGSPEARKSVESGDGPETSPPVILILRSKEMSDVQLQHEVENLGCMVMPAHTMTETVQLFLSHKPDCMVLDQESGGLDVLIALEEQLQARPVPVTVIGSEDAAAQRIQAYRMGADDYLVKPFSFPLLAAVLMRQLAKKRQMERLIDTDEMTGALRQRMLEQLYDDQLLQASATGNSFIMILITLERQEGIHRRYDDLPSEAILHAVATPLIDHATGRRQGAVVRYKCNSFVVLLPEHTLREGTALASQWRRELSRLLLDEEQPLIALAGVAEINEPDRPLAYWLERLNGALTNVPQDNQEYI